MRYLLLIMLAASLAACAAGGVDPAGCGLHPATAVTLTLDRGIAIVPASINSHQASLILDTGAESVLLTTAAVPRLGLAADIDRLITTHGVGGTAQVYPVTLRGLDLGGLAIPDHVVPLLPRTLPQLGGSRPDGLLGTSVLSVFETELDFPGRRMTLYAGRLCPSVAAPNWPTPFSALEAQPQRRGRFVVQITLDGHQEAALIDTGTQVSVITAAAARAVGINGVALDRDRPSLLTGSGPQPMTARLHRFHELRIGGEALRDPALLVADAELPGIDVVLGMDYLAGHRVWLSAARGRVFIDRLAGE